LSSLDLLSCEVVLVLVLDAQLLQLFKLLLLDALDLRPFILQLLPDLAAFLEVVKSLLFLVFLVFRDLLPNSNNAVK
jgi:hypothetical protein